MRPVPRIIFPCVGAINARLKVKCTPDINERTKIERKADLAWRIFYAQRGERLKIAKMASESSRVTFVYSV